MPSHYPRGFGGITQGVIQAASASGKRRAPVMRLEELHQACLLYAGQYWRQCPCVTLPSSPSSLCVRRLFQRPEEARQAPSAMNLLQCNKNV